MTDLIVPSAHQIEIDPEDNVLIGNVTYMQDELNKRCIQQFEKQLNMYKNGLALLTGVKYRRVPELDLVQRKLNESNAIIQQQLDKIHQANIEKLLQLVTTWEHECELHVDNLCDSILADVYPLQNE